jgi:hypothetical protein
VPRRRDNRKLNLEGRLLPLLAEAARLAAADVEARPTDGSFLESTLERAIAIHLPGTVSTSRQRSRFPLAGFDPHPFGVDIEWTVDGVRLGIETKVTDVVDSLFDVVKLATAVAEGKLAAGFCAVAATERQWARGGPIKAMVDGPRDAWRNSDARALLAGPARTAVLVASGPRPKRVPASVRTLAAAPIEMPKAPTHVLRLLAVDADAEPAIDV